MKFFKGIIDYIKRNILFMGYPDLTNLKPSELDVEVLKGDITELSGDITE